MFSIFNACIDLMMSIPLCSKCYHLFAIKRGHVCLRLQIFCMSLAIFLDSKYLAAGVFSKCDLIGG